jgi:hypothetical protein
MTGHSADPDLVGVLADVAQLLAQRIDVDQVFRSGEAQFHHRQQRVSAGQQSRLRPEPAQQLKRPLDARRSLVLKRGWNLQWGSLKDF